MSESESTWQQKVIAEQRNNVPKERSRTYYHPDGLGGSPQMWVKHSPGMNIPLRIEKVWPDGIHPEDDYDSMLKYNIGSEVEAYRLYCALEAYFNDERATPWFLRGESDE